MMKTARSMRSTKSVSSHTEHTDGGSADGEEAPAITFEDILPSTCLKFNCPYPIIVRKEYRQDGYLKLLKHSERKIFKKINLKVPMIERSSLQQQKKKDEIEADADEKMTEYDKLTIVVTSIYDNLNRLITLAIYKTNKVPRVLIQCIGLLAPNFDMLNNITLTGCGIDGQIIYELARILSKTAVSEICLDQSPIPEGNYALLLEMPSRLRNLSLCRCKINDAVVRQLAEQLHYPLPAAQALQLLNLASNHVTDAGARHLAAALRSNRRLRYLNLSDNKITDSGATHLFNVLKEFPLTTDELLAKRKRLRDYVLTRMELCIKFMFDFGVKEYDEVTLSSSNPLSKKSQRKKSTISPRNNSKVVKRRSSVSVPHLPPGASATYLRNRAESLAGQALGPFVDPFSPTHVVVKNEWPYCHGNFALSYLNLAYNSLSFISIKNLHKMVSYQSGMTNPHETGLLKIMIEGNHLPGKVEELEAISAMLVKNMGRYTGTGKPSERRTKSRVTTASTTRIVREK